MVDVKYLPDDVRILKKVINEMQVDYKNKIEALLEDKKYLIDKLFGSKSEKFYDDGTQGSLFNEAECEFDKQQQTSIVENEVEVKGYIRKKKGRKKLPESLEREIVTIDIPESEKVCASGKIRKFKKWEISEKFDIKPPEAKVIQTRRAVYGCPDSRCFLGGIGIQDINF